MADASRELKIILNSDTSEAESGLKSFGNQIGGALKNNVVQIGAAFTAVTGIIYTSINAYEESARSLVQLDTVLESTKGAAGVTKQAVIDLSTALQQQTAISDESITATQNMLLTFTSIGKDVFPDTTKAVLDMATAMNGGATPSMEDLKAKAILVGKALQDPDAGLGALKRVGVNVEELKAKFTDSMSTMEKQKMILQELGTEFGGSATARLKTFSGQMELLKNNVNDVQETIGKGLVDTLMDLGGGFDNVNKKLANFNTFLNEHKDVLKATAVAILVVAGALGGIFIAAMIAVAGTAGLVIAAIGAITAAIAFLATLIIENWNSIKANTEIIWQSIIDFILNILKKLHPEMGVLLDILGSVIKSKFDAIWGTIKSWTLNVVNAFNAVKDAIGGAISKLDEGLKKGVGSMLGISQRALGGTASGLTLVGERGPELVNLPNGSFVHTNEESSKMMGGATVNIYNPTVRNDNDIAQIVNQIKQVFGRDNELARLGVI